MSASTLETLGSSVSSSYGIPDSVFQQQISSTQFGNLNDSQMVSALNDIASNDSSYLAGNPGDYSGMLGNYNASSNGFATGAADTSGSGSSGIAGLLQSAGQNVANNANSLGWGTSGGLANNGVSGIWKTITDNMWNIFAVVIGIAIFVFGLRGLTNN